MMWVTSTDPVTHHNIFCAGVCIGITFIPVLVLCCRRLSLSAAFRSCRSAVQIDGVDWNRRRKFNLVVITVHGCSACSITMVDCVKDCLYSRFLCTRGDLESRERISCLTVTFRAYHISNSFPLLTIIEYWEGHYSYK